MVSNTSTTVTELAKGQWDAGDLFVVVFVLIAGTVIGFVLVNLIDWLTKRQGK